MPLKRLASLAVLLFSLVAVRHASADSIVLLSVSGSTFTYGLTFSNSTTTFNQNNTITISGLSGVSSVTASQFANYLGYTTSNSTSVTLSMAGNGSFSAGPTQTLFTVVAAAHSNPLGQYSIVEAAQTESGTVQNAVTPEPSSLVLLATGLFLPLGALVRATRLPPPARS